MLDSNELAATKKFRLLKNLKDTDAETLKQWLIEEISLHANENSITEGVDGGGELEDFYLYMPLMFFRPEHTRIKKNGVQ